MTKDLPKIARLDGIAPLRIPELAFTAPQKELFRKFGQQASGVAEALQRLEQRSSPHVPSVRQVRSELAQAKRQIAQTARKIAKLHRELTGRQEVARVLEAWLAREMTASPEHDVPPTQGMPPASTTTQRGGAQAKFVRQFLDEARPSKDLSDAEVQRLMTTSNHRPVPSLSVIARTRRPR